MSMLNFQGVDFLGGGFKYFYFHPDPRKNDPIWRTYFSKRVNQPPTTVDGKNPAPVDMVNIPSLFSGFYASQVVQDFFHQQ